MPDKHAPQTDDQDSESDDDSRGPTFRYPEHLKETSYALYCKGKTSEEIGQALGIRPETVRRWSSKGKWKNRKLFDEKGDAAASELVSRMLAADKRQSVSTRQNQSESNSPASKDMSLEDKQAVYRDTMAEQGLRIMEIISSLSPEEMLRNAEKLKHLDNLARKALDIEDKPAFNVIPIGLLSQPIPDAIDVESEALPAPATEEPYPGESVPELSPVE